MLLLGSLFVLSCDEDNPVSGHVNPLVGVWEMTQIQLTVDGDETIITSDEDFNLVMVYNIDGTFSYTGENINGDDFNGNGTWSTNGSKLTTIEDDGTNVLDFSISGNTLIISDTDIEESVTTVREVIYIKI